MTNDQVLVDGICRTLDPDVALHRAIDQSVVTEKRARVKREWQNLCQLHNNALQHLDPAIGSLS